MPRFHAFALLLLLLLAFRTAEPVPRTHGFQGRIAAVAAPGDPSRAPVALAMPPASDLATPHRQLQRAPETTGTDRQTGGAVAALRAGALCRVAAAQADVAHRACAQRIHRAHMNTPTAYGNPPPPPVS